MPTSRQRPQRSRLGLVVVLGVMGWLVYMAVMGGFGSGPDYEKLAFRPLPYVVYGLKPDFERSNGSRTNSVGFRGDEIEMPKPAGRFRILCLGGSTTYTSHVPDGQTYPELLEQELRTLKPEMDIEVINGGVESYTSAESLANLAYRCLEFEPDIVVVYHGANDYRPRRYPDFDAGYADYRQPWSGSTEGFEQRSGELGGINAFIQIPPRESSTSEAENARANGTQVYRRNLLSLIGVARVHGIQPVLVTFAPAADKISADAAGWIAEHNEVVRDLCQEQGVPCIDFAPRMTQRPGLWADEVHVTPEGAAIKARLIAEDLATYL